MLLKSIWQENKYICTKKEAHDAMKTALDESNLIIDMHNVSGKLNSHLKSHKTLNKTIVGFLLANAVLIAGGLVYTGSWKTKVEMDISHNKEMLTVRTEDRFFKQDGDVLETKMQTIEDRQDRLEAQYDTIDTKLDRIIENK